jgi:hypothetical protein
MDAYRRGLNGKQASWACKRYRGHRVLPENILKELEQEDMGRLGSIEMEPASS